MSQAQTEAQPQIKSGGTQSSDTESSRKDRRLPLYDTPRPLSRLSQEVGVSRNDDAGLLSHTARGSSADLFTLAANRLGYGPVSGQRAEWNARGANDEARYADYLDEQLNFTGINDSDYTSRRSASGYVTLDKTLNQLWIEYERDLTSQTDSDWPQEECELDWFLRSIYSKRQLEQIMTEFWVDHFNVYSRESPTDSLWPNWVKTLRNGVFGNFRTLLGATSEHPVMLYYLDQYTSTSGGPNENYCRELFEIHTLGAENYIGLLPPQNVGNGLWGDAYNNHPHLATFFPHPNGIPDGYVDTDIFQATQAFAGYTYLTGDISSGSGPRSGDFFFESAFHNENVDGVILNFGVIRIPNSDPETTRAPTVLDMLAYHPGTARHICRKLVRRFVQDDPPESLVNAAAEVFITHYDSSDQIKQVLLFILQSPEFKSSFGLKMKRPFDVVVSMLRATSTHLNWSIDGDETYSFLYRMERTGHRPFRWRPPDGYPDIRAKWQTASPRVMTWRLGQWLSYARNDAGNLFMPINARTPGSVARTPNALVDYWLSRIFTRTMPTAFREEIVDFLAQGFNPDNPLNLNDSDTEERLQAMMALIMATAEFCER